jgi:hypothetical protein
MYLLKVNPNGGFSLINFFGVDIPIYAILSHTWESDDQEVTFQDLQAGIGSHKAGYKKIQLCGYQAEMDGIDFFWIDSCCIDKSSSAQLSESINSMYRWYRNAAKCYVYLSDVSLSEFIQGTQYSHLEYEPAFGESRWFTRGWTLQELLAPLSVEFFSREWRKFGSKESLETRIHEITGIPIPALQGAPLSQFSITERMSWAANRKTRIEEDQAYCLLGIFDVHLSWIYGEGKEHAFRRLQMEISAASSK